MEENLEIHIRDRNTMRRVVSEGIGAVLAKEYLADHYVSDVDSYEDITIIYLKEKYSGEDKITFNLRRASGTYLKELPASEK